MPATRFWMLLRCFPDSGRRFSESVADTGAQLRGAVELGGAVTNAREFLVDVLLRGGLRKQGTGGAAGDGGSSNRQPGVD